MGVPQPASRKHTALSRFLQFSKEAEILNPPLSCQTHMPPSQGMVPAQNWVSAHCTRAVSVLRIK